MSFGPVLEAEKSCVVIQDTNHLKLYLRCFLLRNDILMSKSWHFITIAVKYLFWTVEGQRGLGVNLLHPLNDSHMLFLLMVTKNLPSFKMMTMTSKALKLFTSLSHPKCCKLMTYPTCISVGRHIEGWINDISRIYPFHVQMSFLCPQINKRTEKCPTFTLLSSSCSCLL